MVNVMSNAGNVSADVGRRASLWKCISPFVMPSVGAVVVLLIAFQVGREHYGVELSSVFGTVKSAMIAKTAGGSLPFMPQLGGVGGAGRQSGERFTTAGAAAPSESKREKDRTFSGAGGSRVVDADAKAKTPSSAMAMLTPPPPSLREGGSAAGNTAASVDSQGYGAERIYMFGTPAVPSDDAASGGGVPSIDLQQDRQPGQARTPATPKSSARDDSSPTPAPAVQLKVIKTGDLAVEVAQYAEAVDRLERIVTQFHGFMADASTREEAGGALVGRVVIRVAPESFDAAFSALKAIGRVESENVKAADVTAEYVDVDARIRSLQISEERLQELIKSKSIIDKVSSLLEVEKELTRVRSQIEQLQGQMRVMSDRIAFSTITMTVREPARTVPAASLSMEVKMLEEAATALGETLARTGGRLVSAKTSKRGDGTLMGTYQLAVTLNRFSESLSAIESLGRIEERQVKDRQFSDATAPWANEVKCSMSVVLFERSRQLPTGSMRIEIDALGKVMPKLDEILAEVGAAMTSNQTTRQADGSSLADLRIRVPAGKFTAVVDAFEPLGRTTAKNVSGEAGRIIGGAATVPCEMTLTLAEKPREVPQGGISVEVDTFENARKTLSAAIAETKVQVLGSTSNQRLDGTWVGMFRLGVQAGQMEAFVTQLERLGRVVSRQISGLGLGDLSRTDPGSLGVIELTLSEKSTIAPASYQAAGSIRNRLHDGLAGLYSSVGLIAYGLVVLAPWLLFAGIVGWVVARVRAKATKRGGVAATGGSGAA